MNTAVNKLKTWLQSKHLYSDDDFVKSAHQDDYFCLEKLEEIFSEYELEVPRNRVKEFGNKVYIKLTEVERLVKTKTNVRDFWVGDLLEVFGLIKVKKTNGISYISNISDPNIKLSGQYKFTYTIWKWVELNYPELDIKIEENFLSRFDIELGSNRGPRVDIVIDSIKIVIEYDELQHEAYENTDKDSVRDKIIQAFGYQVLRFKEKDQKSIFQFIKELAQVIKDQDLKENPEKFASYIIDFFVAQGYRKDIIEKLSQEVIDDIISKVPYDQIGNTPKKIRLNKDIFAWLKVADTNGKNAITKLLVETIDDDLYIESTDDSNDYILSPNAFEIILAKLDPELYLPIEEIRNCYIGIKNKLYHFIYSMYVNLKQDTNSRIKLLKYVNKEGYLRGEKDTDIKVKKLQKTIGKLKTQNEFLNKFIAEKYPKDGRGLKKINPPTTQPNLSINKPIVSEIPELVYTGEQDDYVEEEEIKTIFEINKNKFRTKKTSKSIIQEIKKRIGQEDLSKTLVAGFIFKCKIVYVQESKLDLDSESESDADLDSDSEQDIKPKFSKINSESSDEELNLPQPKQPRSKSTSKKVNDFIDDSESDEDEM